ncbi:MAG: hypothetical protein LC734_11125, partial [Acidobacteria bacterium]|nr:hypothetical protein [Acidobacteriota bacterium]
FAGPPGWTILKGRANGVETRTSQTNTTNDVFAVEVVPQNIAIPVYNLSVADHPEFFANGVLVHNCDAGRYASYSLNEPLPVVVKQPTYFSQPSY